MGGKFCTALWKRIFLLMKIINRHFLSNNNETTKIIREMKHNRDMRSCSVDRLLCLCRLCHTWTCKTCLMWT